MTSEIVQNQIRAFRIGWPLADGKIRFLNEAPILATRRSAGNRDSLPVEFFSHQLLELDTASDESILEFTTEYGIPRHPSRLSPLCGTHYRGNFSGPDEQYEKLADAKQATDESLFKFEDKVLSESKSKWTDSNGEEHQVIASETESLWFETSLEEVRFTLFDLQYEVKTLFDFLSGSIKYWNGSCINGGASNKYAVHAGVRQFPDYSLTQGICNQIIETIAEDTPWKVCACEGCGRLFKRQQSREDNPPKTNKLPSRSKYCSIACQNRQGQRNRRRAAYHRIRH